MRRSVAAASLVVIVAACSSNPPPVPPPPQPREAPLPELPAASSSSAPSAPAPDAEATPLPTPLVRHRAPSGLSVVAVPRALDVVHVRVVVRGAGLAADPASALSLAAELTARVARSPLPMAGDVHVEATRDALVVRAASTDVRATFSALGPMLRSLGKTVEPAAPSAYPHRDVALYRALFKLPASTHPYAELVPTGQVGARELARFADARVVGDAITVVLVGPAAAKDAADALDVSFTKTTPAPAVARPTPPISPESARLFVVDMPRETASVVVGFSSLDRGDDAWPELLIAVRARETALAAKVPLLTMSLVPVRDGACPVVTRWDAKPDDVVAQVKAVLDALPPDQSLLPSPSALAHATRSLAREHAMIVGQPARLADHLAELAALGRDEAPAPPVMPTKPHLAASFADQPPSSPVVVVEGDASKIAESLASLGDVNVLDPRRALASVRLLKHR